MNTGGVGVYARLSLRCEFDEDPPFAPTLAPPAPGPEKKDDELGEDAAAAELPPLELLVALVVG